MKKTRVSCRESFVATFGEEEARKLECAADMHRPYLVDADKYGSDPFKDVLSICIGFQCFEVDEYRDAHGITAPFSDIKEWIRENADMSSHDGIVDWMSVFCGKYLPFIKEMDEENA